MSAEASTSQPAPDRKQVALDAYKAKIKEHETVSESLKTCEPLLCSSGLVSLMLMTSLTVRKSIKDGEAAYEKSEEDIKALQSVGQIVGECLRQLDEERCELPSDLTSTSSLSPCAQSSSRRRRGRDMSWDVGRASISSSSSQGYESAWT